MISDNYGDHPAPRRYFLKDVETTAANEDRPEKELDWRSFSVILMRALLPFPDAKAAVLEAFRKADAVPASP